MTLANPAGLALLVLAVPIVLLHVLRPRRRPVTVSSTLLWRRLERPVAALPWQRLRWSLLLLAQLLAVALLALAVARPERTEAAPLAEHTVFVIDVLGSMSATDGSPTAAAVAVEEAGADSRSSPRNRARVGGHRRRYPPRDPVEYPANHTRLALGSKPPVGLVVHCAGMVLCKDRADLTPSAPASFDARIGIESSGYRQ